MATEKSIATEKVKGRFVLSYNDAPEIRDLYTSFTILSIQRYNSLANKQGAGGEPYKELIIKNF